MPVGVNERAHLLGLRVWVQDRHERVCRAERVPDAVERVPVWLVALPQRVVACDIVGREKGAVEGREDADSLRERHPVQARLEGVAQDVVPAGSIGEMHPLKGIHVLPVGDLLLGVATGTIGARPADAYPGLQRAVGAPEALCVELDQCAHALAKEVERLAQQVVLQL